MAGAEAQILEVRDDQTLQIFELRESSANYPPEVILFDPGTIGTVTLPGNLTGRVISLLPRNQDQHRGGGSNGGGDNFHGRGGWGWSGDGGGEHNNGRYSIYGAVAVLGAVGLSAGGGLLFRSYYYQSHRSETNHSDTIHARIDALQLDITLHGGNYNRNPRLQVYRQSMHPKTAHDIAVVQQDTSEVHALQAQLPNEYGVDALTGAGVGAGLAASLLIIGGFQLIRNRRKRRK
ncbi:MAG TPA: hypothetical protein VLG47_06660 [Candidatus Saccharimonadales bacterium]|nr:hypothetical protein [Candidatus Saccharimonadales bacterium]